MTAKTRMRSAAAIALTAAVGVLGLPSQALAGKSHHLKLYKVEMHVDVEGDLEYDVSCKPGDIATDGMWRIDDVSQDNEFDILEQWALTVPIKAASHPTDEETYLFRFLPIAGGDVQGKLIVTCVENPVDGHGHSHSFNTTRFSTTQASINASPASPTYTMFGAGTECLKNGGVPIAPGFDISSGDGYGYVTRSWQTSNATHVGWEWRFHVAHADVTDLFTATTSFRCLERRSNLGGPGSGHRHRIIQQYKTKMNNVVPARTFRTHEVHCGEHYKGMVGMWSIDPVGDYHLLYFLGMDPRIKSRAFKFVNVDNVNHTVDLGLSCFKDRTS